MRCRKEDEMKTDKGTNKNGYGWRCRTPLPLVLGLLAVVVSRLYADPLPIKRCEVLCRGKGNKRDCDTNENCYLGPQNGEGSLPGAPFSLIAEM